MSEQLYEDRIRACIHNLLLAKTLEYTAENTEDINKARERTDRLTESLINLCMEGC